MLLWKDVPNVQPVATPDDCFEAEAIAKQDATVKKLLADRGITDTDLVACDPWCACVLMCTFASEVHLCTLCILHVVHCTLHVVQCTQPCGRSVHLAPCPGRLIQTFMYHRSHPDDNHYCKPLDFVPVVDLHLKKVLDTRLTPTCTSCTMSHVTDGKATRRHRLVTPQDKMQTNFLVFVAHHQYNR